jgi:hypothetical protein
LRTAALVFVVIAVSILVWSSREESESHRLLQMQAQTDGWICRQLQAITLCTPPKFERKVLNNGELNSAIFVDTRSSQPFLPPAVFVYLMNDEQILKLVFQLHGNNGEVIEGLNTIANERAVVWVRMCQLWAAAKESRDPTADYFEEALMIIAMVDETVSNLDQFASDQLKTAELHPSMLNAVVSVLVTKPSSDELKPVLDGLHAISRRVAPGTIHSLMAVYNDAPGDRAKDVAAHGIQAWLAGKHLILPDEARKNGGVVNVSHPTLAAAVTEIVAGGDIARDQMTSALQCVDQVLRDGSPDDRLNAEAERAVMLHVLERIPR